MALKTLVLVALLKLALSRPDPNVNVNVDVHVEDKGCCNNDLSCVFGDTAYPDKAYLEETCMEMQCIKGTWNYTGKITKKCTAECTVYGEPHFQPFDYIDYPPYQYDYQGIGSFVISQPGLNIPAEFGVNANFEQCAGNYSCVASVNYYEPGITIDVTLTPSPESCHENEFDPIIIFCAMQVSVNNKSRIIGKSVSSFSGTDGTVLVFSHNHIDNNYDNFNCINIVGSKGFSMSFCQQFFDYPWFYVWAMPNLENKIYGLCDKYTGQPHQNYTMQNGSTTTDASTFAPTWKIGGDAALSDIQLPSVTKCANTTLLSEITEQCTEITKGPCNSMPYWQCEAFKASCIYDLCRVPNRDAYAQGYISHTLVESHFAGADICHCEYIETKNGCIIIQPAPANTACQCLLSHQVCVGTVVTPCAQQTAKLCLLPDTTLGSCLQAPLGNCAGY